MIFSLNKYVIQYNLILFIISKSIKLQTEPFMGDEQLLL